MNDHPTHPIARLPGRLASLLLLTGDGPVASSRLASQPGSRTLGRVQLRFLGLLLAGLAGCGSFPNNGNLGKDSSGSTIRPLIPNSSIAVSKSLTIPLEALALGAVIFYVVDPLSPNWQIEQVRMSENRFRIALRKKRFTTGGDGEATQIFYRRAEQIVRENGYAAYTVLEFGEGVESTVPIAQRVAQGVIEVHER